MPKVNAKAVLEIEDVKRAMSVAEAAGPFEAALFAWLYEFGARAAEPGLQLVKDVDLRGARARIVHLKTAAPIEGSIHGKEWDSLLPFCRRLLPLYMQVHAHHVLEKPQAVYLFPSRSPGDCCTCLGTGKRKAMKDKAWVKAHCHHCGGSGKRWGITRHDVYHFVTVTLAKAGVPEGFRHPHVLRHSVVSHLLDGEVAPTVIQERVGHRFLSTTLGYMRTTKAARSRLEGALKGLYDGGEK